MTISDEEVQKLVDTWVEHLKGQDVLLKVNPKDYDRALVVASQMKFPVKVKTSKKVPVGRILNYINGQFFASGSYPE